MAEKNKKRDQWASKIGLVLAMAGNAVGLGNFIRFPMQAASNGGGVFMIPYLIAFLFLGIPLMFVEWGMGRYGGSKGHATMPGIFALIRNNKLFRILGSVAIWIPLVIASYYCFIESWSLGYSFFSITGMIGTGQEPAYVAKFFADYTTISTFTPYLFFIITIFINGYVLYKGVSQGIEKLAKILMPMLFIFAVILVIRIFTLSPEQTNFPVLDGFGFIWNPDFSRLGDFSIWVAAAGQIFFTLSLGMGAIACYASYVKKDDDVVVSGIATALTNETCEVVLGGSIAIPLAVAFFGMTQVMHLAKNAGLGFGFVTMPLLFSNIAYGHIFGALWFLLLFFAGITSSIAMGQIVVAFLHEIVGFARKKAVLITMAMIFALSQLAIFSKGSLDEMDNLAGTLGLTFFALIEVVIWVHLFGINKSWKELIQGSKINLWSGIKWIMAYISPVYLSVIIIGWIVQNGQDWLLVAHVEDSATVARIWITRAVLAAVLAILAWLSTMNMHKTDKNILEEVKLQ